MQLNARCLPNFYNKVLGFFSILSLSVIALVVTSLFLSSGHFVFLRPCPFLLHLRWIILPLHLRRYSLFAILENILKDLKGKIVRNGSFEKLWKISHFSCTRNFTLKNKTSGRNKSKIVDMRASLHVYVKIGSQLTPYPSPKYTFGV